ncbi:hypothetical protein H8E65_00575 [Candidatus Bathyarchaeota archaeon]|nr:hypothetical protein [Candidatus Bathyarchaeota archaeon]
MHQNLNNPPLDERNPKTLPITIESYQKEHLFNTKKRTTEEVSPQATQAPFMRTVDIQYQNNPKQTPPKKIKKYHSPHEEKPI